MTDRFLSYAEFEEAAAVVQERIPLKPTVGLILGSGLSPLADRVKDQTVVPYHDIPHFPTSTVEGHSGRLVVGKLGGQQVAVMQGRTHYYEGYSMSQVTFPVRVLQVLGIERLIVTNAAGGLNTAFEAGDIMRIEDHINLVGIGGANPLVGPNIDELGPRFPDMSQPYDPKLRDLAEKVATEESIHLQRGTYAALAGPSFETPAEIHYLRTIGADAVGMSTVPEVIVARHGGTRVLGLSGITNVAAAEGAPPAKTTHEEVLEASAVIAPKMETLIVNVLTAL